jgi:hypothetical protein
MAITADQATAKWLARLSAAQQQITDGVQGVTVAPGTKAAAAKAVWVQAVTASQDKWASRVGSVSLGAWQAATIAGIPRIAMGAQAKQGKVQAFMAQWLPYVERGASTVRAMPKGIARAVAQIQYNAQFKRTA